MRAELGGVAVFTAVLLSGLTAGSSFELPSPSNVTITCDSYGVMVSWTSSGLSENASFNLQLKSNNPSPHIFINTSSHQYNISELLQDTGYNHYLVEVKARDGEYESPPADSKKFSFSYLQNADIQCNLAFPPVDLIPGERRLFFRFSNPLQLYRRTPALRSLTAAESLCYDVFDNRARTNRTEYITFECTSKTCEGNVSFPVEQEEYCVKLSGRIRQTRLEETKYLCYCGSLGPRVPITVYLIPLFLFLPCCALSLAYFLAKEINKKMKKKYLSKFPKPLRLPFGPSIDQTMFIIVEDDHFENRVIKVIHTKSPDASSGSSTPPYLKSSHLSHHSCGNDLAKDPEGGELKEKLIDPYSNGAEMSTGGLPSGYDRPH
ncbi:interferon gamma receptor 1 precursor [Pygocentrus nattereri]|uniref:Fibronectin type-III domain-containing protein n=1 Tax=Pygocentrus nattereri TaxID=42514 RepID=A0A3B4E751_PYGNA|nr:interferon gamma receptor 1 precursor [Pygocentrus nattereri]